MPNQKNETKEPKTQKTPKDKVIDASVRGKKAGSRGAPLLSESETAAGGEKGCAGENCVSRRPQRGWQKYYTV